MGVFDKAIIPPTLLGYEMIIANSYPMRSRGIVGNCVYMYSCTIVLFSVMFKDLLHFLNWSNPPQQSPLVG